MDILNQARTDTCLRGMSPHIGEHFETVKRRRQKRQRMWGGNLSVLEEQSEKRSNVIRRSLAFERIMTEMPIAIERSDVLVGSCSIDDTVVRCTFPKYIKNEELGLCSVQMSHKCPDYETLLKRGLRDIIDELKSRKPQAEAEKFEDKRREKLEFIEGCVREAESVIAMAHRYAKLAMDLSESEEDETRKSELVKIAEVCMRVPEYPARGLHEAAQSVWFFNYALFESNTNISIGNIDRVLYPYFQMDIENNVMTLQQAQEIVDSFVLHCNDRAQIDPKQYFLEDQKSLPGAPEQFRIGYGNGFVTSLENDQADAINHWGQNILLSGLLLDGSDATNPLTYLFLNAHEKFSMTAPVLTVRMHSGTPEELLERASEVLKTGGGMPYINNDDVIVGAYEALGVPREDGSCYANSNCWETLIQGRSNQEMIRGLNFLYFLELALGRGEPFIYGEIAKNEGRPDRNEPITFGSASGISPQIICGVDTGDISKFETFEDLMQAWKIQMDSIMQNAMAYVDRELHIGGSHGPLSSNSALSTLTRDCVENLTDIAHRGARYDMWHLMGEAAANAADAMAAIKRYVYEEKKLSLTELTEILKNNWQGADDIYQLFAKKSPKFGNNDDYVDSIAAEMVDYFVQRGLHHGEKYPDIVFSPCLGTYSWIISIGKKIGASADGRMSQEPIASNMSPVPGSDISGPTKAIQSYWKLNTKSMAAGAPIDLRVSNNGLEGDEGTRRISALIKTFLEQGGNMMTLTITSADELRRAIEEPEKYQGLRVRMGGWSAYFALLSKASQEIHLKRVEHGV